MKKLYNIVNYKTNIKGYWKKGNKLYKDNIRLVNISNNKNMQYWENILFNDKRELAIFYKYKNIGHVKDKHGNITLLRQYKRIKCYKIKYSQFKSLLNKYGGLTIYKHKKYYIMEIFYNE